MKKMLDAAYESAMLQASIYRWYKFKSSRKGVELMSGSGASTTANNQHWHNRDPR